MKAKFVNESLSDSFVIEVEKNNRKFFLSEIPKNEFFKEFKLTWRKESALSFSSIAAAEQFIKDNNLEKGILWHPSVFIKSYEIKNYNDVKSH